MSEFINRPRNYKDESDVGYMLRLAKVNYCDVRHLGFKYPRVSTRYDNEEEILTLKVYLENLKRLSGEIPEANNILYNILINRLALPKMNNKFTTRYCPLCISQLAYHRTN